MFKKFIDCLTRPNLIGQYIGDSIIKVFGEIILFILVICIPVFLLSVYQNDLSNYNKDSIKLQINNIYLTSDLTLADNQLSGEEVLTFNLDGLTIFINPLEKAMNKSGTYFEFRKEHVDYYIQGLKITSVLYKDLKYTDINFQILNEDVLQKDNFFALLNELIIKFSNYTRAIEVSSYAIYLLIVVVISSLIGAVLSKLIKPIINFRNRFIISLNCSFIYLFAILLGVLFNNQIFMIIGGILQIVYTIRAILPIIRIEVIPKN